MRFPTNTVLASAMVIIPLLGLAHIYLPHSHVITFNLHELLHGVLPYPASIEIPLHNHFVEWKTFMWQLMIHGMVIVASVSLLIGLNRFIDWRAVVILMELFFINTWYFWRTADATNIMHDDYVPVILISLVSVASVVMIIRRYRTSTWQEKYLELISAIDELAEEEREELLKEMKDHVGKRSLSEPQTQA